MPGEVKKHSVLGGCHRHRSLSDCIGQASNVGRNFVASSDGIRCPLPLVQSSVRVCQVALRHCRMPEPGMDVGQVEERDWNSQLSGMCKRHEFRRTHLSERAGAPKVALINSNTRGHGIEQEGAVAARSIWASGADTRTLCCRRSGSLRAIAFDHLQTLGDGFESQSRHRPLRRHPRMLAATTAPATRERALECRPAARTTSGSWLMSRNC